MKPGTKISWVYKHHLNNKSSVWRKKNGIYIGKVKHTRRHFEKIGAVQMAVVKFNNNKNTSRVPFDELEELESADADESELENRSTD